MFKFVAEQTFTHTVKVMVPVDGGFDEQSFKATFRVEDVEKLAGIQEEGGQAEVLRRVIVDLDEVAGPDGAPLPYSDKLRDQLIGVPYVRIALFLTYVEAVSKARAGN